MKLISEKIVTCPKCDGEGIAEIYPFLRAYDEYHIKLMGVCDYCNGAKIVCEKIYHEKFAPITEDNFGANEKGGKVNEQERTYQHGETCQKH